MTTLPEEIEPYTIPYHGNKWCGPAALAYVMRSDPDTAARLLREVSGKKSIKGTYSQYMLAAMGKVGLSATPVLHDQPRLRQRRLTLKRWVALLQPKPEEQFLVLVTGHYVIIHGDLYFDNQCHLGKPVDRCPYLRSSVKAAWQVTGTAQIPAKPGAAPPGWSKRTIELEFGVRIEGAKDECEVFPVNDFHYFADDGVHSLVCSDLTEVLTRISAPVPCPHDCDCRMEA